LGVGDRLVWKYTQKQTEFEENQKENHDNEKEEEERLAKE
jgi:hypothetical protein